MDYRLLILALGTFAIGTDNYVIAGILPQVARSMDVSVSAAGQFVTIYSLTYAVSTPIMATLTANWPGKRVLLIGLTVFAVGNILTATQQSFEFALMSRAVAGLGGAIVTPAAGALAAAMVPPEWRGRALAIVLAGLTAATALGAPIGTLIGSFGDWRMTMWFVTGLGTLAFFGITIVLPSIRAPSSLRLRDRLAPLSDARVAATLATTLLGMFGQFLIYTYVSVVFDRATGGNGTVLAALMSIWGIGATVGIMSGGSLADCFGNRPVINLGLLLITIDFVLMPWISASFTTAAVAIAIWGVCGWGFGVSQQHRLVGIAPKLAPILLALNASAIYVAVSASGAVGALAIKAIDPYNLPFFCAIIILGGLFMAELARWLIQKRTLSVDVHVT